MCVMEKSVASCKMFRCSLRVRGREYFSENGDTLPLARDDILLKHMEKKTKKKKMKETAARAVRREAINARFKFF